MPTETAEQAAFVEVWELVCEISTKDKTGPLNKLPGPWYRKIDDKWELWINGTPAVVPLTEEHPELGRFEMFVKFNGWPAGILDPHQGSIAAGEIANIFTFRDALKGCLNA